MALRALAHKYGPAAVGTYAGVTTFFFTSIYATLSFGRGAGVLAAVAAAASHRRTVAPSRLRAVSTESRVAARGDSSSQNIHLAAAAPPRRVSAEYPRLGRDAPL